MVGDQDRDKKKVLGTTLRARDRRARDRNNAATVAAVAVATAAAANGRGHASTGGPRDQMMQGGGGGPAGVFFLPSGPGGLAAAAAAAAAGSGMGAEALLSLMAAGQAPLNMARGAPPPAGVRFNGGGYHACDGGAGGGSPPFPANRQWGAPSNEPVNIAEAFRRCVARGPPRVGEKKGEGKDTVTSTSSSPVLFDGAAVTRPLPRGPVPPASASRQRVCLRRPPRALHAAGGGRKRVRGGGEVHVQVGDSVRRS